MIHLMGFFLNSLASYSIYNDSIQTETCNFPASQLPIISALENRQTIGKFFAEWKPNVDSLLSLSLENVSENGISSCNLTT